MKHIDILLAIECCSLLLQEFLTLGKERNVLDHSILAHGGPGPLVAVALICVIYIPEVGVRMD